MNKKTILLLSIVIIGISCTKKEKQKMMNYTIELVKFKSKKGIDPSTFTSALITLDHFIKEQPGFIARELSSDKNGLYVDYIKWVDLKSANIAAKKIMKSEKCMQVFALIDEKSIQMSHTRISHFFQRN